MRNNVIRDCGQAGIVGSLGAVFSTICNNHIFDIWTKRTFAGAEMAGIKIHAPIDMLITENRIHNTGRGIWIDWMGQGTRISRNVLYNNTTDDLFTECNHGPIMVDNNLFLSESAIKDWSEGGAFAHNLIAGRIVYGDITARFTPYHFPHSTKVAGLSNILGGDNCFYNNIFIKHDYSDKNVDMDRVDALFYGLKGYEIAGFRNFAQGNAYYNGAEPDKNEWTYSFFPNDKPVFEIEDTESGLFLTFKIHQLPDNLKTTVVATAGLGVTIVSEAVFENPDGSSLVLNRDYFGNARSETTPTPGPFEALKIGENRFKIWE